MNKRCVKCNISTVKCNTSTVLHRNSPAGVVSSLLPSMPQTQDDKPGADADTAADPDADTAADGGDCGVTASLAVNGDVSNDSAAEPWAAGADACGVQTCAMILKTRSS